MTEIRITRHFATIVDGRWGARQVHYRRAGRGPVVLCLHQSPLSSRDMLATLARWHPHFTCIAPDTPGFGSSTPLGVARAGMEDFADAVIEFMDALGIGRTAVYGFLFPVRARRGAAWWCCERKGTFIYHTVKRKKGGRGLNESYYYIHTGATCARYYNGHKEGGGAACSVSHTLCGTGSHPTFHHHDCLARYSSCRGGAGCGCGPVAAGPWQFCHR